MALPILPILAIVALAAVAGRRSKGAGTSGAGTSGGSQAWTEPTSTRDCGMVYRLEWHPGGSYDGKSWPEGPSSGSPHGFVWEGCEADLLDYWATAGVVGNPSYTASDYTKNMEYGGVGDSFLVEDRLDGVDGIFWIWRMS